MKSGTAKWLFWGITIFVFLVVGLIFLGIFAGPMSAFEKADMPFSLPRIIITIPAIMATLIFCIAYFVYKDAPKRGLDPWLWMTIAVYVPNLIGLILYFIMRNNPKKTCKSCKKSYDQALKTCPFCGETSQVTCNNCFEVVEENWNVCPHCGEPVRNNQSKEVRGSSNYIPLVVAGILIVSVFLGMIVMFFHLGGFSNFDSEFAIARMASEGSTNLKSSHVYYTGSKDKKIFLEKGYTVRIIYDVATEDGELSLGLFTEDGEKIENYTNPTMGELSFTTEKRDTYVLKVRADSHKGSYDIKWKVSK